MTRDCRLDRHGGPFSPRDSLLRAYDVLPMPDGGFNAPPFFRRHPSGLASYVMQGLSSPSPSRDKNGSECFYRGGLTNGSAMSASSCPPVISSSLPIRFTVRSANRTALILQDYPPFFELYPVLHGFDAGPRRPSVPNLNSSFLFIHRSMRNFKSLVIVIPKHPKRQGFEISRSSRSFEDPSPTITRKCDVSRFQNLEFYGGTLPKTNFGKLSFSKILKIGGSHYS